LNHEKEELSTEMESGCSRGGTEKKAGFISRNGKWFQRWRKYIFNKRLQIPFITGEK